MSPPPLLQQIWSDYCRQTSFPRVLRLNVFDSSSSNSQPQQQLNHAQLYQLYQQLSLLPNRPDKIHLNVQILAATKESFQMAGFLIHNCPPSSSLAIHHLTPHRRPFHDELQQVLFQVPIVEQLELIHCLVRCETSTVSSSVEQNPKTNNNNIDNNMKNNNNNISNEADKVSKSKPMLSCKWQPRQVNFQACLFVRGTSFPMIDAKCQKLRMKNCRQVDPGQISTKVISELDATTLVPLLTRAPNLKCLDLRNNKLTSAVLDLLTKYYSINAEKLHVHKFPVVATRVLNLSSNPLLFRDATSQSIRDWTRSLHQANVRKLIIRESPLTPLQASVLLETLSPRSEALELQTTGPWTRGESCSLEKMNRFENVQLWIGATRPPSFHASPNETTVEGTDTTTQRSAKSEDSPTSPKTTSLVPVARKLPFKKRHSSDWGEKKIGAPKELPEKSIANDKEELSPSPVITPNDAIDSNETLPASKKGDLHAQDMAFQLGYLTKENRQLEEKLQASQNQNDQLVSELKVCQDNMDVIEGYVQTMVSECKRSVSEHDMESNNNNKRTCLEGDRIRELEASLVRTHEQNKELSKYLLECQRELEIVVSRNQELEERVLLGKFESPSSSRRSSLAPNTSRRSSLASNASRRGSMASNASTTNQHPPRGGSVAMFAPVHGPVNTHPVPMYTPQASHGMTLPSQPPFPAGTPPQQWMGPPYFFSKG